MAPCPKTQALSPAINDPGTAIDILGRALRLFSCLAEPRDPELMFPRLWVPPLALGDMMDDIFTPIALDGAALFSVRIRLQKALLALAQIAPGRFSNLALQQSETALLRCQSKLLPHELALVTAVCEDIRATAQPERPRPP